MVESTKFNVTDSEWELIPNTEYLDDFDVFIVDNPLLISYNLEMMESAFTN
jgi:hypothetical protein